MNSLLAKLEKQRGGRPRSQPGTSGSSEPKRPSPPSPKPAVVWDQTIPCTIPAGRRICAQRRVHLLTHIRLAIYKRLDCNSKKDHLPPPPPDDIRMPTPERFFIHWQQSPKSIFNRAAANIILQDVCRSWGNELTDEEKKELPSMIAQHVKYLSSCYKEQEKADAESLRRKRLKRASAHSRMQTLYHNRLQIIDRFPNALGKHRQLIVHLGLDGTSLDEEDPDPAFRGLYRVKQRPELSSKICCLKHNLDTAYNLFYKGPGLKGSQVHHRVRSELVSTRPFRIEGLPITCMSQAWLAELDEAEKEFYGFSPHRYDYGFPESLLKLAVDDMEESGEEDEMGL
ncbi:hypothetical protein BDV93DRAFT_564864 [Ceratobasidium sp. AG-I]|nr:hypothetical protein BDV93DRAFT_564864 [Ceratobasidium sp. AG-I]